MIVNGKKIATGIYESIYKSVERAERAPHLTIFTCEPNFETKKFLTLKETKAKGVGIEVSVKKFSSTTNENEIIESISSHQKDTDAIVVQLPFPAHINSEKLIMTIPNDKDADAFMYSGEETEILPPVVGAISTISKEHNVVFKNKNVVVVGEGRLVGKPATAWAKANGAKVTVVNKKTKNIKEVIETADVLILGAGKAGLVTSDMVKEGVIIFDAGTSEDSGVLKGDADPDCASKADLFTPVPGGIGPVTVAVLLKNVLLLTKLNTPLK